MILYVCDYVIRAPFQSETRVNLENISWEHLSGLIIEIFNRGGSLVIYKTEAEYREEYGALSYHEIDSYSMICDERYGYLIGCSISESKEYPEGTYLKLVNKNEMDLDKVYIFSPYDDEYNAKFVNQDINIALEIFKEIFHHGHLSSKLKSLFLDNSENSLR